MAILVAAVVVVVVVVVVFDVVFVFVVNALVLIDVVLLIGIVAAVDVRILEIPCRVFKFTIVTIPAMHVATSITNHTIIL